MTGCRFTISRVLPFIKKHSRGGSSRDSQNSRQPPTLNHILNDDCLLDIFCCCRPVILDESEAIDALQFLEEGEWNRERWWYGLVQVCRRWRYLILGFASHLRLSLVCAPGTPVKVMLANSPPLPLIIDHFDEDNGINAKDEEGLIHALQQRDRVRRIRLVKPVQILEKLIISLDGEFPILEYLVIENQQYLGHVTLRNRTLNLPETFRAPHLRRLILQNFTNLTGSPSFTTMGNLVNLFLNMVPPSAYFHPNALLQRLSLIPQLEIFGFVFNSDFPGGDIGRQLLDTPITMRVTLPSLRWFAFQGVGDYLEALLLRVTIPLLERLQVKFYNQLTDPILNLQELVSAAGNLQLNTATITFAMDYLVVMMYPHKGARTFSLEMTLGGRHLDWQVALTAQVFHTLRTAFSVLEHLTLQYRRHSVASVWGNKAHRAQWRKLLGSFDKVNTLHMEYELVGQLSHSLQPREGESPTELLPELQELSYSARGSLRDAFMPFVDSRWKAGCPVAVIRR